MYRRLLLEIVSKPFKTGRCFKKSKQFYLQNIKLNKFCFCRIFDSLEIQKLIQLIVFVVDQCHLLFVFFFSVMESMRYTKLRYF